MNLSLVSPPEANWFVHRTRDLRNTLLGRAGSAIPFPPPVVLLPLDCARDCPSSLSWPRRFGAWQAAYLPTYHPRRSLGCVLACSEKGLQKLNSWLPKSCADHMLSEGPRLQGTTKHPSTIFDDDALAREKKWYLHLGKTLPCHPVAA